LTLTNCTNCGHYQPNREGIQERLQNSTPTANKQANFDVSVQFVSVDEMARNVDEGINCITERLTAAGRYLSYIMEGG
jgi:hypothetical protein